MCDDRDAKVKCDGTDDCTDDRRNNVRKEISVTLVVTPTANVVDEPGHGDEGVHTSASEIGTSVD